MEAKFSGAMAVAAGPTAYFELVKAVLMARLPSSVAPKFGGLELELWWQAEEVLLAVLAAGPQARARMWLREPVELAILLQGPVTKSWLRWEGLLFAVVGQQAGRQVQRPLQVPQLIGLLPAKLQQSAEAEEVQMSSVRAMRLGVELPQRLIVQPAEAGLVRLQQAVEPLEDQLRRLV